VLSHSRKEVLVWCQAMDQLAWHHAHNEAFRRLGGVPAVLRIDNLKTGVGQGAGPWGQLNEAYRNYAKALGFHVDACLPRCPEDKGKVESKVGHLQRRLRLGGQPFAGLADLQAWSDAELAGRVGVPESVAPVLRGARDLVEAREYARAVLEPEPAAVDSPETLARFRELVEGGLDPRGIVRELKAVGGDLKAVRLALTGRERGPELAAVIAALPRDELLRRALG